MPGAVQEVATHLDRKAPARVRRLGPLPTGVSPDDLPWDPDTLTEGILAVLNLCLDSVAPTALIWGEDRRLIYNQAYTSSVGTLHPGLFGAPLPQAWPEDWAAIGAQTDAVFASGQSRQIVDQAVVFVRDGQRLDRYVTYHLTPVRASDDSVIGLYIPVLDSTERVLGRRRLATLHDLAAAGVQDRSSEHRGVLMSEVLAENSDDVPFSLLYRIEPSARVATLQATTGLVQAAGSAPRKLRLNDTAGWSVAAAISRRTPVFLDDVQVRFPGMLVGRSGVAPRRALVSFVDQGNARLPNAINILGVAPELEFDAAYQAFLHEVDRHLRSDLAATSTAGLERERTANLQLAMQSNRQIGTAIGILMAVHGLTEQAAFQVLSRASQRSNRKLREIADGVVLTGTLATETTDGASRSGAERR